MTKLAFVTDEHFPYQDEHARYVALQIVRDYQPDIRIAGSDGMDFYSISKFDKNPKRVTDQLQEEIDSWSAGQREWISAAPEAHAFFIIGNHEDRLRKYLWKHPELSGLEVLQLPTLLNLASLGIYWEKNKGDRANYELNLFDRLIVKHGDIIRTHSSYTARAELEREAYSISVLTGHSHRGGTHYMRTRQGIVLAQECFCLCDLEPEYIAHPNWQQGLVLAEVTAKSLFVEPIPFYNVRGKVRAIWRGNEYRS
jgi:hypothetical protein